MQVVTQDLHRQRYQSSLSLFFLLNLLSSFSFQLFPVLSSRSSLLLSSCLDHLMSQNPYLFPDVSHLMLPFLGPLVDMEIFLDLSFSYPLRFLTFLSRPVLLPTPIFSSSVISKILRSQMRMKDPTRLFFVQALHFSSFADLSKLTLFMYFLT